MCGRDGETLTNAVLWELERVVCKRSCNPARLEREANDRPGLISRVVADSAVLHLESISIPIR